MNKQQFIDELCSALRMLPADEAQRTVLFYSEAIDDRIEDGWSETDAVNAMGSIDDIVREVSGGASADEFTCADKDPGDRSNTREPREVHRIVSSVGVTDINITETSNSVKLIVSPDENIHVKFTECGEFGYEITEGSTLSIRRYGRESGAGFRRENGGASINILGIHINIPSFSFSFFSGEQLIIMIPANSHVNVSCAASSGDIECEFPGEGSVNFRTASGDMRISGGHFSSVIMSSASGDAEINDSDAEKAVISTVSGDVQCDCGNFGELLVKTVSGDCDVASAGISGRLSVSSISGDIGVHLNLTPAGVRMELESLSGDIDGEFPGSPADYTISAKTVSGSLSVPDSTNCGPCEIRAKSSSGDIDLCFEKD